VTAPVQTASVPAPPDPDAVNAAKTRLLVELWWEQRERRWAKPVLRGWVRVLPDGVPRAFASAARLTELVLDASRVGRPGPDEPG
jgi:hypothetical protein